MFSNKSIPFGRMIVTHLIWAVYDFLITKTNRVTMTFVVQVLSDAEKKKTWYSLTYFGLIIPKESFRERKI